MCLALSGDSRLLAVGGDDVGDEGGMEDDHPPVIKVSAVQG
jgi:hypothetical protein